MICISRVNPAQRRVLQVCGVLWLSGVSRGCQNATTKHPSTNRPLTSATAHSRPQVATATKRVVTPPKITFRPSALPPGTRLITQNIKSSFSDVAFSCDGKLLAINAGVKDFFAASQLSPATVQIFNIAKGTVTKSFDTDAVSTQQASVMCLAFSPTKTILAAGTGTNEVYLWDANTGKRLRHIKIPYLPGAGDVSQIVVRSLPMGVNSRLISPFSASKPAR